MRESILISLSPFLEKSKLDPRFRGDDDLFDSGGREILLQASNYRGAGFLLV